MYLQCTNTLFNAISIKLANIKHLTFYTCILFTRWDTINIHIYNYKREKTHKNLKWGTYWVKSCLFWADVSLLRSWEVILYQAYRLCSSSHLGISWIYMTDTGSFAQRPPRNCRSPCRRILSSGECCVWRIHDIHRNFVRHSVYRTLYRHRRDIALPV